jgi:hypothetical protein
VSEIRFLGHDTRLTFSGIFKDFSGATASVIVHVCVLILSILLVRPLYQSPENVNLGGSEGSHKSMARNSPMLHPHSFGNRRRLPLVAAVVAMATLVCTAASNGAIIVDSSANVVISGSPSPTFGEITNFTVGNNNSRMLLVAIAGEIFNGFTSVKYGSQSLTLVATGNQGPSTASIWALENPLVGSADVEVTRNVGGNGWRIGALSIFSDTPGKVLAISDTDTASGNTGTSATLNLTNQIYDFVVLAAEKNGNGVFGTTPPGLTNIFSGNGTGGYFAAGSFDAPPSASSFTWTFNSTRHAFAGAAISEVPEPASLAVFSGLLATMGFFGRRRLFA